MRSTRTASLLLQSCVAMHVEKPTVGRCRGEPRVGINPMRSPSALAIAPARYVRTNVFEAITGYSANAVEKKIQAGAWVEGREFRRAPDGHLLIDMRGYEQWVESH